MGNLPGGFTFSGTNKQSKRGDVKEVLNNAREKLFVIYNLIPPEDRAKYGIGEPAGFSSGDKYPSTETLTMLNNKHKAWVKAVQDYINAKNTQVQRSITGG